MASLAKSTNLFFFVFALVLAASFSLSRAAHFEVFNNCPFTVWAGASPGGGAQLNSRQPWGFDVPAGTAFARVWPRTNCRFDGSGRGHCETGDCGGLLRCQGYGAAPNTLVEYALNQYMNRDYVDLSVIEGFNVPVAFSSTSGGCNLDIRCTDRSILADCPNQLRVLGGCNGACPMFNTDQYCCNLGGSCNPTYYSKFFKDKCPQAFSYPKDNPTSSFTCPGGTNYKVVFCP